MANNNNKQQQKQHSSSPQHDRGHTQGSVKSTPAKNTRSQDSGSSSAEDMYERVKDVAQDKYERVKDVAQDKYERVKDVAQDKYERVRDVAQDKYDRARDIAQDKYDRVKDVAQDKYDRVKDVAQDKKRELRQRAGEAKRAAEDSVDEVGGVPRLTTMILIGLLLALSVFYLADLGAHKAVSSFERYDDHSRPFYKKAVHRVQHAVNRANPFHTEPKHFTLVDWFHDKDESYVDKIDRTLREYLHTAEKLAGYEAPKAKGFWGRTKQSVTGSIDAAKDKASDSIDQAKDIASESYDTVYEKYNVLKKYLTEKGVDLNDTKNELKGKADVGLQQAAKKKKEYERKMNTAWNEYVSKNADKFKRNARLAQKEAELKSRVIGRKAANLKDRVKDAYNNVAEEAGDRFDQAKKYAKNAQGRVQDAANDVRGHAQNAKNRASQGYEDAKDAAQNAKNRVKNAGRQVQDAADDYLDDGKDTVHGLRENVMHQANIWKERAKEFTDSWFGKSDQDRLIDEAKDRLEDLEEKAERQRFHIKWLEENKIDA